MKSLHMVTFVLLVVGGLNWGLYAFNPDWNLVKMLLGSWPAVEMVVYVLVALSAIHQVFTHKSSCKDCTVSVAPQM